MQSASRCNVALRIIKTCLGVPSSLLDPKIIKMYYKNLVKNQNNQKNCVSNLVSLTFVLYTTLILGEMTLKVRAHPLWCAFLLQF